jgi:hypothetical protein
VKYFINIPWWGETVFRFISLFLSEQTKKKFVITSHTGITAAMLARIPDCNLPKKYGGSSVASELSDKKSGDGGKNDERQDQDV